MKKTMEFADAYEALDMARALRALNYPAVITSTSPMVTVIKTSAPKKVIRKLLNLPRHTR